MFIKFRSLCHAGERLLNFLYFYSSKWLNLCLIFMKSSEYQVLFSPNLPLNCYPYHWHFFLLMILGKSLSTEICLSTPIFSTLYWIVIIYMMIFEVYFEMKSPEIDKWFVSKICIGNEVWGVIDRCFWWISCSVPVHSTTSVSAVVTVVSSRHPLRLLFNQLVLQPLNQPALHLVCQRHPWSFSALA